MATTTITGPARDQMAMHLLHRCPVFFAGWESNVARLYSEGWKMHADMDVYDYNTQVCLVHSGLRLAGFLPARAMYEDRPSPIYIKHVMPASHGVIEAHIRPDFMPLRPECKYDMETIAYQPMERFRLADLFDFEHPQELIVDPNEVQSLLSRVVELQRPKQKEIRGKERKKMRRTEAQIITLHDYEAA